MYIMFKRGISMILDRGMLITSVELRELVQAHLSALAFRYYRLRIQCGCEPWRTGLASLCYISMYDAFNKSPGDRM